MFEFLLLGQLRIHCFTMGYTSFELTRLVREMVPVVEQHPRSLHPRKLVSVVKSEGPPQAHILLRHLWVALEELPEGLAVGAVEVVDRAVADLRVYLLQPLLDRHEPRICGSPVFAFPVFPSPGLKSGRRRRRRRKRFARARALPSNRFPLFKR